MPRPHRVGLHAAQLCVYPLFKLQGLQLSELLAVGGVAVGLDNLGDSNNTQLCKYSVTSSHMCSQLVGHYVSTKRSMGCPVYPWNGKRPMANRHNVHCTYVYTYECMNVCMYLCLYVLCMLCLCVCMSVCMLICMYVCMYVCIYVRMCVHACMYVCMHV